MRSVLFCLFLAAPALGETPLNGDQFEAIVEGKTVTFSTGFGPYGVEYYAPNRQVIWSFIGGECKRGEWYEAASPTGPNICFEYEDEDGPKCWQIFSDDGRLRAEFVDIPGASALIETEESEPLVCGGVGA